MTRFRLSYALRCQECSKPFICNTMDQVEKTAKSHAKTHIGGKKLYEIEGEDLLPNRPHACCPDPATCRDFSREGCSWAPEFHD